MQTRVQFSPYSPAGIQGSARLPPSKFILYTVYDFYKVGLYPRIGSFTTLKSWISRSVLGTTDEIALLPTLGIKTASRMRQNCIEILLEMTTSSLISRRQEFIAAAADFRKKAAGCVAATSQAGSAGNLSCNSLPAHICQPTVPATNILHTLSNFFSRIFSNQVPQILGLHRCPRPCGRMGGGTG